MDVTTIETKELLLNSSNENLAPLVEYILKTSTEELSGKASFKLHKPDHSKYVDEIYDEIRLFGGNSFVNLFRSSGPSYREVLDDAASKVGVKKPKKFGSEVEVEQEMIQVLVRKAAENAKGKDREELEAILKEVGMDKRDYKAFISGASLVTLLVPRVYQLLMLKTSAVIASAVSKQLLGHGFRAGAGLAGGKFGAILLGPVGWVLAGVWTAIDIAGPAYRVTVPCALHIAMLRQKWICDQEIEPMLEVFDD